MGLPINDLEFPLELFSPTASQVREVNNPLELGGFITKSFINGDLTLSYFDGYDRIFSPSGVNVWQDENNIFDAIMDTVFTYRKTNVIGMGTVLFLGELTLRGDFAYFTTKDRDIDFLRRALNRDTTNGCIFKPILYEDA